MKIKFVCAACLAMTLGSPAGADDEGLYVSAAVGGVQTPKHMALGFSDVGSLTGERTDTDTTWGLNVGFRLHRYFAVELGYLNLSEVTGTVSDETGATDARAEVEFSADGVTLAALGILPLGNWEPYVKAGALFSNTALEYSGAVAGREFGGRVTNETTDPLVGIGVSYALNERFKIYVDSTYVHEVGEPRGGRMEALNTSLGLRLQF